MKQLAVFMSVFALLFSASTGDARNTIHQLSIADALAEGEEKGVLIDGIALYFGDAATPAVEKNHGEFTANRKTNAFNKSDEEACSWVFLTAVKALQERARKEGGNAVINIYSYYYKNTFVSQTEFECGAGTMVAGVTMIGDVVTLGE
ncbi:MAG: excinuclease ABC subunit A [Woeseiaceae bacterium]|nr:excinuclease ABC subunit A [Woeseiaceae bacterium]